MDLNYSEEQDMLKTMAKDFLEDKCPKSLVKELEESDMGYSPELWSEIVELGWMGLMTPEAYGGSEMSFLDLAVVLEEIGKAALPGPYFSTVVLGSIPIMKYGNEEQKREYLGMIAGGEAIFTAAITEEDGTFEAECINLEAKATEGFYILNGTKLFVPDANVANYMLCVARTSDDALTVFIVDMKAAGITVNPLKTMAKDRLCEVVFKDVSIPVANVLGEVGNGLEVLTGMLQYAAAGKCCTMIGAMQQSLDLTVDYAKERSQYGHPIGSYQAVQHYCANMTIDVDSARYATYKACWELSEEMPAAMSVAVAKAFANEAFERVSTLAHQIHGAIGCTIDHDLHYSTRTGKAAALSYGSSDYYREIVANEAGL